MDIRLKKNEFLDTLHVGGSFAGINRILPILDYVKVKVKDGALTVVSSDSENTVSKRMRDVGFTGDGTWCVKMKDLSDYVRQIPDDEFTFSVSSDCAEVRHTSGKLSLPVMSDEHFPHVMPPSDPVVFSVDGGILSGWLSTAMPFVGNDELRQVMGGIYFYRKGGEFGCCSTNGASLYTDCIRTDDDVECSLILNRNAAKAICGAVRGGEVKVSVGDRDVMFTSGDVSFMARLVEGKYPNFKSVIPNGGPVRVKAGVKEMVKATKRCAVGCSRNTSLAIIRVTDGVMEISCSDIDFNKESVERLAVESDGEITIGFNYTSLVGILDSMQAGKVVIEMSDGSHPALFTEENGDGNKKFVLMPIMISV